MRSRTERTVLAISAVVLVAAAAAAWWTQDRWLPHAGPWAEQAWRKATRPGADTLAPEKRLAPQAHTAQPRRCVKDGRTTYTDQPCPPDSQELLVDGAVTPLPR